ncbi:sugar-transfer associated ATP-grasp domain-containing protein [Spongiivirga sp. MCCC 1A20706]|uniref:sugar-transfer associated ATP-grasp domain-containing protein n=1 Tax=Spongiivirga sp. MCCC 1A20706 TaxID=3160963 RepID=UPI003977B172
MRKLTYFLNDTAKKSYPKIIWELLYLFLKKRTLPTHYFAKYLYRKDRANINDYLTTAQVKKISFSRFFNEPAMLPFFENKPVLGMFCEKNGLPYPKILAVNYKTRFNNFEGEVCIDSNEKLMDYLKWLMAKQHLSSLFIKEVDNYGGAGCYKVENNDRSLRQEGLNQMLNGNFFIQECIQQHDDINTISPRCVNSIRFDTYVDQQQQGHILTALMRFGVGDSVVDNASSGGFYVGIDMESGTLKKEGQQLFSYGARSYDTHPDTGVAFEGFKIPFFKEATDLVHRLMKLLPDGFVGWDIAIASTGPVIIEGNTQPGILMSDVSYGGLLKHPKYQEILKRLP